MVSRSSTEVEYRSLSITTAKLFWIRMLFRELRVSLSIPSILRCDNIGALALVSNPMFHARTKYIEVDYHFVREKVLNRDILIKFISTHDQVVDVFTKGLPSARFLALKVKLMVVPPPINLWGGVKGYKASVRSSAGSITALVASSESNEESRRVMRSSTHARKAHSRNYKKSADQSGKTPYITRPPLTTYRESLQYQLPEIKSATEGKKLNNWKTWTTRN